MERPEIPLTAGGLVTEDELRRYLRHASVLLGSSPGTTATGTVMAVERCRLLRRAEQWLRVALLGVEQLAREAESQLACPDTLDEPLTAPSRAARMSRDEDER